MGQNVPENKGNKGVLRNPEGSSITGTSPLDWFVSHLGHSLVGFYPICSEAVNVFYSPSRLGHRTLVGWESKPFAVKQSMY